MRRTSPPALRDSRPSRLVGVLVLNTVVFAGCRYHLIPESRICEDLAFAISERTLVCEEDEELANQRHDDFLDATECLLPDKVKDEYNPNGILPADDNPEETERLEGLYDCVRAARKADCERVIANGDDPSFWIRQDPQCQNVVSTGGAQ